MHHKTEADLILNLRYSRWRMKWCRRVLGKSRINVGPENENYCKSISWSQCSAHIVVNRAQDQDQGWHLRPDREWMELWKIFFPIVSPISVNTAHITPWQRQRAEASVESKQNACFTLLVTIVQEETRSSYLIEQNWHFLLFEWFWAVSLLFW